MFGFSHRVVLVSLWLLIVTAFCDGFIQLGSCGSECNWRFDDSTGALTISGNGKIDDYCRGSMFGPYCFENGAITAGKLLWKSIRSRVSSAVIMDGITHIGKYAFDGCTEMTSLTIANTVDTIDDNALVGCTNLKTLVIPDSVTSFWDNNKEYNRNGPLDGCDSLEFNEYENGLYIGNPGNPYNIFVRPKGNPQELKEITTFKLHERTRIILGKAFSGCTNMKTVSIPDSVVCIGYHAFYDCEKLEYTKNGDDEVLLYLGNERNPYYALITAQENGDVTSIRIHDRTVVLANFAFMNCYWLETMIFGEDTYYIGSHLMTGWNADGHAYYFDDEGKKQKGVLKKVTLTSNRAVQLYKVYLPAENIVSLTLTGAVTDIPDEAFSNTGGSFCRNLKTVSISDSLSSIGINVFEGCNKLAYTTYRGGQYLGNDDNPFLVLVQAKDKTISSVKIHGKTKIISAGAFSDCNALKSVVIPEAVTRIGTSAFFNCSSLKSVNIQSTVPSTIGNKVFKYCNNLESVVISDSVTSIGDETFNFCRSIKSLTMGSNVQSIGMSAFEYCSSVNSFTLPSTCNFIGRGAFSHCGSLEKVSYSGTSDPGKNSKAFVGCPKLDKVEVPKEYTDSYFCGKKINTSAAILNSSPSKWLMTLVALFAFVLLFP